MYTRESYYIMLLYLNSILKGTALSSAYSGEGTGRIWLQLDEVSCTGSESEILDCRHDGIGVHDCNHFKDASVRCEDSCK